MQIAKPYDEHEVLVLVANGDQKAFTKLVDIYWNQVYIHALAYSKCRQVAQEFTQDIFLKVWNKKEKLPEIENFKSYLFILGRNQLISIMRKKLEEPVGQDFIESLGAVWMPDQQVCFKEVNLAIMNAIDALPPARRTVFKMSRIDGLTYQEIADILHISKNTVKEHVSLSLNFLRTYLHAHGDILPWFFLFYNIF